MTDDLTTRLTRALAEHRATNGFYPPGTNSVVWRYYACTCEWYSTADQEDGHRAHVAAVLAEGVADWLESDEPVEVAADRMPYPALPEQTVMQHLEASARLALAAVADLARGGA